MNPNRRELCCSLSALAVATVESTTLAFAAKPSWPIPPQPARIPAEVGNFGHRRIDDYAWLRPKNWHEVLRDPSTLEAPIKAVIDAEMEYSDAMLRPTQVLQAELRARAAALTLLNGEQVEIEDGDFLYFERRETNAAYPVYFRRHKSGGAEQILLDPAERAKGQKFYALHWSGPLYSRDHKLLGWAEDLSGSGMFRLKVQDIATGRIVVDNIDTAHGSFSFDPGGNYLFWVGRAASGVANSVWRRDLASGRDIKIYDEEDPSFFIDVRTFASGGFVSIRIFNGAQTEVRLVPADKPTAAPILVEPRTPELRYNVDHWNGRLVILTDADGATDMKVMTAPVERPGRANWKTMLAHEPGRFIAALHPFRNQMVREEWRDAKPHLVVMNRDGGERDVVFEEPAYTVGVPQGQGWGVSALAFTFQSPRLPPRSQKIVLETAKVQGSYSTAAPGFDPARFDVERIEAVAEDGARIPITLLRRKGIPRDGKAPLFLYGYGSYGATVEATFQPSAIALVERGWTFAIAHVRGGAERGNDWWRSVLTCLIHEPAAHWCFGFGGSVAA